MLSNELWLISTTFGAPWELLFGSPSGHNERISIENEFDFSPNNTPGARSNSALWIWGNLVILFGGFANDASGNNGNYFKKPLQQLRKPE